MEPHTKVRPRASSEMLERCLRREEEFFLEARTL
jgi:hypothetical protein